jgi:hypothetical protein
MSESVWLVDKYCDRITERPIDKRREHWGSYFSNRSAAVAFTILRAEECVKRAEHELKSQKDRVRRLKKKYRSGS